MLHGAVKSNKGCMAVRGFTIVELLTVMLIITLLVAMVIGVVRYTNRASLVSVARADLERLHAAVEAYEREEGAVPDVDAFHSEAFVARVKPPLPSTDPWGSRYAYTNVSVGGYVLYCVGEDAEAGTMDDIHSGE